MALDERCKMHDAMTILNLYFCRLSAACSMKPGLEADGMGEILPSLPHDHVVFTGEHVHDQHSSKFDAAKPKLCEIISSVAPENDPAFIVHHNSHCYLLS
jgi:hypothetical protein